VLSVAFSGSLSDEMIKSYLRDDEIFFSQSGCRGLSDRLLEAGERKNVGTRELFDEFMLFLLRGCQRLSANRMGENDATLSRRICRHIHRYGLNGKLSVKSIAEAFSIRVQDLQLLWKESFGMTVHRYIQEMRLARAAELLALSNVSISQIAEETGYTDRCYLDKLFLKKYGVTPSVYRKSHGQTE
jgi:AraC-like DNA-binding protein